MGHLRRSWGRAGCQTGGFEKGGWVVGWLVGWFGGSERRLPGAAGWLWWRARGCEVAVCGVWTGLCWRYGVGNRVRGSVEGICGFLPGWWWALSMEGRRRKLVGEDRHGRNQRGSRESHEIKAEQGVRTSHLRGMLYCWLLSC